jgi:enoyl-CoA hydratase/carnithine racemase
LSSDLVSVDTHDGVAVVMLNRPEKRRQLAPYVAAVADSAVPVVAAVNGPAVTGGLELAMAADFIVASERAWFADLHLRVGHYPPESPRGRLGSSPAACTARDADRRSLSARLAGGLVPGARPVQLPPRLPPAFRISGQGAPANAYAIL